RAVQADRAPGDPGRCACAAVRVRRRPRVRRPDHPLPVRPCRPGRAGVGPGPSGIDSGIVVNADRNSTDARMRTTLAAVAPGTELREGLERILRGRTGALLVLGHDRIVDAISTGGVGVDAGV